MVAYQVVFKNIKDLSKSSLKLYRSLFSSEFLRSDVHPVYSRDSGRILRTAPRPPPSDHDLPKTELLVAHECKDESVFVAGSVGRPVQLIGLGYHSTIKLVRAC